MAATIAWFPGSTTYAGDISDVGPDIGFAGNHPESQVDDIAWKQANKYS